MNRSDLISFALNVYRSWRIAIEPERQHMRKAVGEWLGRMDPHSVVIEIGAGTGFMRPVIERQVPQAKYLGSEVSPTANSMAVLDVCHLPLTKSSADVVLAMEVLEHLPAPQRALAEIADVLKPGGTLIVTVPFMFGVHDLRDYFRFTPLGMETLAKEHGLTITDVKRRGGTFVAATSLVRHRLLIAIVGQPKDWRAVGVSRKVRWAIATVVLTPWTPVTWLSYLLDAVLDRESGNPAGYFFLMSKDGSPDEVIDLAQVEEKLEFATSTRCPNWVRPLLRCPNDGGALNNTVVGAEPALQCGTCGRAFTFADEIPVLLPDDVAT